MVNFTTKFTNIWKIDDTLSLRSIRSKVQSISASLGSIQPYATINARMLLVHISTTIYSQVLLYSAE